MVIAPGVRHPRHLEGHGHDAERLPSGEREAVELALHAQGIQRNTRGFASFHLRPPTFQNVNFKMGVTIDAQP